MTIRDRLDAAIAEHPLLEHPFYQAWRDGTLPVTSLATYAAEYGAFIAAIDQGWETVGEHDHAAEERHHADLWSEFARAFGAEVGEATIPEVSDLLKTSRRLFAEPATAWGALYAFEKQQPGTAEEKLGGLVAHYGVAADADSAEYFRVHAADYHEADGIVASLESSPELNDAAVDACTEMSRALWDALSGIPTTLNA
jgi:pyrroloquinoline-quinone synthase